AQALRAEWDVVERLAEQLRRAGYEDLSKLAQLRISGETCLLALAVRFFFRQEIAASPQLFQGVTVERIDQISQQMESAFQGLSAALEQHGQRLEGLLESVQAVVVQTHGAVLD